jgi:TAG lipase / steryl ester hydrolase / phospholipase A2 / LPA acyltransferase
MSDHPNENLLQLTLQKLLSDLVTLLGNHIPPDIHQVILQYQQYVLTALPVTQRILYELIDAIFSPELLFKQLLVAMSLQVGVFTLQRIGGILYLLLSYCTEKGRKLISLNERMKQAITYTEWKRLGEHYDILKGKSLNSFLLFFSLICHYCPPLSPVLSPGNDKWRKIESSRLYDSKVLKKRTQDIRWMINDNDIFNLMFRLRGGLARDMFGMQHEGLFSKSIIGTKHLVEEYHQTVIDALNRICDSNPEQDDIPQRCQARIF